MILQINDMKYYVERTGEDQVLLLLHGFTGSTETWSPFVEAWSRHYQVLAVDLPGHGRTDAPADLKYYRMERVVHDLLSILDQLGIGAFHLLGYSMGGRVALHLALAAPERVRALILESASPGIADDQEREARRQQDERLAQQIEQKGIEWFAAYWEALPLFASQKSLPSATRQRLREQRRAQRPQGLAGSLRGMGAGVQAPLHARLRELQMPVLLLTGELDEKYGDLAQWMVGQLPRGVWHPIREAGHAVHLEQPARFQAEVLAFLDQQRPIGRGKGGELANGD